jgi:hypothetical protein
MVNTSFLLLRGNLILAMKVGDMSKAPEPLNESESLSLVSEMQ